MTAKRPERGDLYANADLVVLLDELVGMVVFNKRVDDLTGSTPSVGSSSSKTGVTCEPSDHALLIVLALRASFAKMKRTKC